MQFLKILFWCLLAFVAALFTFGNWFSVPIRLWGGLVAETNLPFLILATFLLGLVPTLAWQHAVRWRLRSRLAAAERRIAELSAVPVEPLPPVAPSVVAAPIEPSPVA